MSGRGTVFARFGFGRLAPVLAGLVTLTALLLAIPATAAPAASSAAGWDTDAAKAAVKAGAIARVGNAPGLVDTAAVAKALQGTDIRVVFLPFTGLAQDARDAASKQDIDLEDWAETAGYRLVEARGLQIAFDMYTIAPSDIDELEPILARFDVTRQVLYAISHLKDPSNAHDEPLSGATDTVAADPAVVARVGDALAKEGVFTDPSLGAAVRAGANWSDIGGGTARVAYLPPVALGAPIPDLASALHERFPKDVVLVAYGRWIEVAAPDPDMARAAQLSVYGTYLDKTLEWDISQGSLVNLTVDQIRLLRTGVTTDETAPSAPADPVASAHTALPWIFGALVLVIVLGSGGYSVMGALRRRAAGEAARRATAEERRTLGARLTALAAHIAAVEPLAHEPGTERDLTRALERYRTARDVLTGTEFDASGNAGAAAVTSARRAVADAEKLVAAVGAAVGVPVTDGAGA